MSFNTGAKLDPSQVEDVRGSRIGGRGLVVGGGGIGVIVALVWVLLGGSPQTGETLGGLVDQTIGGGAEEPGPASSALATECQTGADANASEDCRIVGYVNSIQAYWTDEFAASGERYVGAKTRFFTDQISTGCGVASSASGPFYCPSDALRLHRPRVLRRAALEVRRPGRPVRPGLHPRPRVRAPCPGPGRNAVGRDEPGGADRAVGPDRAPGRLLRGRLGEQRGRDRTTSCRSRTPRSPTRSMPRRPSATTGSSRRCRARSTPRPGPTARPPSARSGSRPATQTGRRMAATRSAATPEAGRTQPSMLPLAGGSLAVGSHGATTGGADTAMR